MDGDSRIARTVRYGTVRDRVKFHSLQSKSLPEQRRVPRVRDPAATWACMQQGRQAGRLAGFDRHRVYVELSAPDGWVVGWARDGGKKC